MIALYQSKAILKGEGGIASSIGGVRTDTSQMSADEL